MCDIVSFIANVATGGLYSVGKAALSDKPLNALLTQGLDLGMAATGNQIAVDIGGPTAGAAFNAAGGLLGAAGSAGVFASGAPEVGTSVASGPTVASSEAGLTAVPTDSIAAAAQNGTTAAGFSPSNPEAMIPASGGAGFPEPSTLANPELHQSIMSNIAQAGQTGAGTVLAPDVETGLNAIKSAAAITPGWFASLPPMVQGAVILAGGQMLTGAAGGLFQGLQAEKKLALEQLINQQRQDQIQYLNQNNRYVPKVQFKPRSPGLINTPAGRTA